MIFPDSDIHTNETAVSKFAEDLRISHEMLGGDVSFTNSHDIQDAQDWAFFEAFLAGRPPPSLTFDVDAVLEGERNAWLKDMHITTGGNFGFLADGLRTERAGLAAALTRLADDWATRRPTFQAALEAELSAYGRGRVEAYVGAMEKLERGLAENDADAVMAGSMHRVVIQLQVMTRHLNDGGLEGHDAIRKVIEFWNWEGTRLIPHHRISAYLYAAMAWKMASGQKSPPNAGFMNDVAAIATYAPYVDAMFLDRECAGLLSQGPLKRDLGLHSKVYSMRSGEAFVDYLEGLADGADEPTRAMAGEIYGWDSIT